MKKEKFVELIFSVITFIVGVVSVILGIACSQRYYGAYEDMLKYGGDAYTGIQQASAQAANNIIATTKAAIFGFASILIIAGLIIAIVELKKIVLIVLETSEETKAKKMQFAAFPVAPQPAAPAPAPVAAPAAEEAPAQEVTE